MRVLAWHWIAWKTPGQQADADGKRVNHFLPHKFSGDNKWPTPKLMFLPAEHQLPTKPLYCSTHYKRHVQHNCPYTRSMGMACGRKGRNVEDVGEWGRGFGGGRGGGGWGRETRHGGTVICILRETVLLPTLPSPKQYGTPRCLYLNECIRSVYTELCALCMFSAVCCTYSTL